MFSTSNDTPPPLGGVGRSAICYTWSNMYACRTLKEKTYRYTTVERWRPAAQADKSMFVKKKEKRKKDRFLFNLAKKSIELYIQKER